MTTSTGQHEGRLLQHSLLLMVSAQVANVSNVVYHMAMGRGLSADEYGILATMLNMMLVISTPLDAMRNAMAHFSARAHRSQRPQDMRALVRRWLARVALLGVPAGVLMLGFHRPLAAFFHLPSPMPIILAGILFPGLLMLPLVCGGLQGMQRFLWMGAALHGWSVLRLLAALAFVLAGGVTATWGVASHGVGLFLALLVGLLGVHMVTRGSPTDGRAQRGMGRYFLNSLVMLAGYGVMMNSDVMLVRHFQPDAAGHFAWAATIGRSVVFLPMPIAMAMFPKVISTGGTSHASRTTLLRALAMVAGLIALGVAGTWILPWLPLRILYKVTEPTAEQLHLVRMVTLAMSPLGLSYLLLHFEMAQHRFATIPWLLALAASYIGGVALWHDSVGQIIAVLGAVSTVSALVYIAALMRANRPARPAA